MKEIQELLELTKKRAEKAEMMVEELKLKKEKAQTHVAPPVANIEKPGPDRKVEEDESEDQTEESTLLQTTGGGIFGDTEGVEDQTFTIPDPPHSYPSPKGRRGRQTIEKGGEVVKVGWKIAQRRGVKQKKGGKTIPVRERTVAPVRRMTKLMRR